MVDKSLCSNDMTIPNLVSKIFDLSGKTALVTGGSSGLGKMIALGIASFGADVVVADINFPEAQVTKKMIEKIGRKALAIKVDVTKWTQVEEMVNRMTDEFGKVDVSFNIPGINIRKYVLDLTPEEYDKIIEINLRGVFLCSKAVGAIMVKQKKGRMINMASILGHIAMERQAGYASSKGGIIQLTKVLALEWAPYNVQVNALAPAFFKTSLTEWASKEPDIYKEIIKNQRRLAEPWEIIGPAVFLASEASSFVTGTVLFVDGGWTAK